MCFHLLKSKTTPPHRFTYPFCYKPHALCMEAARELQRHIDRSGVLSLEPSGGKMFGVLVAEDDKGHIGFLAAYSGLLGGKASLPYFVGPIYDYTAPDGYFRTQERAISELNRQIEEAESSPDYAAACQELERVRSEQQTIVGSVEKEVTQAKERRRALRKDRILTAEEEALLIRESQYMNANLRRAKAKYTLEEQHAAQQVTTYEKRINEMRAERRRLSAELHDWLYAQYVVVNALGQKRTLIDIFKGTPQGVPPAGSGDCCAPKLLQHAYLHGLHPLCMAEFWWGKAPANELRRHGDFYPACSLKCKPILAHMLQGLDVDPDPMTTMEEQGSLQIVYEDDCMIVADKPAGMLSLPGRSTRLSALDILRKHCPDCECLSSVHRIDMDTSGLLIFAKTYDAQVKLRGQFARHEVKKTYVALLSAMPDRPLTGTISLPVAPETDYRPRQKVDDDGSPAITQYSLTPVCGGKALATLHPITGRTHQLRVHCAHPLGLGTPIMGDRLYGKSAERLWLHAARLTLHHPITGEKMTFRSPVPEKLYALAVTAEP